MKLACLDTQYLLWSILPLPTGPDRAKAERAREFLQELDQDKVTIMVATPVVTELLMRTNLSELALVKEALEGRFFIGVLDYNAAEIAAEIWNARKRDKVYDELVKKGDSFRTKIKVDTLVIAIAAAQSATIYSDDGDLRALATGFASVEEINRNPSGTAELFSEANPQFQPTSPSASPPIGQSPDEDFA